MCFLLLMLMPFSSLLGFQQTPTELVDVRLNRQVVFAGEVLRFSVFVRDFESQGTTNLSQYAYVELFGGDGPIFKQKLLLANGQGHYEYFVPTSLPTGNYYLTAHTRWMKNFDQYSHEQITIINPFNEKLQSDKGIEGLLIKAFPKAGQLVYGKRANLIVTAENESGKGVETSLYLVDQNGQIIQELHTNAKGFATIEFAPKKGVKYKVMSALDKEISTDVSIASRGMSVFVQHTSDEILIYSQPSDGQSYQVRVMQKDRTLDNQTFTGPEICSLPRNEYPRENLQVVISTATGNTEELVINNGIEMYEQMKAVFGKRTFSSIPVDLPAGDYSISITDVVLGHSAESKKLMDGESLFRDWLFENELKKQRQFKLNRDIHYLPEVNAEIISGKIRTASGQPVFNKPIVLSFDSETPMYTATVTDAIGEFDMFYRSPQQERTKAVLSVYDFENTYEVEVKSNFIATDPNFHYSKPEFEEFELDWIKEKAIQIQLENSFFETERSLLEENSKVQAIGAADFDYTFELDDYTRFKTIREHFVEYISVASMPRNKKDLFFVVTPYPEIDYGAYSPLVIIDGVIISNSDLVDISPYSLKAIDLMNTRFFLNGIPFDGVVNFRSFERSFESLEDLGLINACELETAIRPQKRKVLFDIDRLKDPRMPDKRTELTWVPSLRLMADARVPIDFYTSDVTGDFVLTVQGRTVKGTTVRIEKFFKVEDHEK